MNIEDNNYDELARLAGVLVSLGNINGAINLYEYVVDKHPHVVYYLGKIFEVNNKEYGKAIMYYEEVLKMYDKKILSSMYKYWVIARLGILLSAQSITEQDVRSVIKILQCMDKNDDRKYTEINMAFRFKFTGEEKVF